MKKFLNTVKEYVTVGLILLLLVIIIGGAIALVVYELYKSIVIDLIGIGLILLVYLLVWLINRSSK